LSRDAVRGGESRRDWAAGVIEAAIYTHGAMQIGYAERLGEAKCFTDVT